jgi:putative lipoprotein
MSVNIGIGTRLLACVALASFFGLRADAAMAQSVQGTAMYRERMALPPAAVFEATLEDVSRADAPAETIGRTRVASPGNPPIAFTIAYDPARILPDHRYAVRARILVDDKILFTTDTATPVITRGSPSSVSMMLRRAGTAQAAPPNPAGARPLEGTYWKAIELAGKPTPTQDANREAHLIFRRGGRLSGSDGCNRIAGSYELEGDVVTFGQGVGTQMACLNTGETDRAFRDALKSATRLTIVGDRLDLFDMAGRRLAAFAAGVQASPQPNSPRLAGTAWRLVKFQGGDDTTLRPDDGGKYTIKFDAGGRLTARIDCNRGRSAWKSTGSSQLRLGPLALTRAKCPPGSLHDQVVKQWSNIRSYVVKDGHLFLALMADGGIYEFEPLAKAKP